MYRENSQNKETKPKLARALFYASIIALCLGVGNITFGNIKYAEYQTALDQVKKEKRSVEPNSKASIIDPSPRKKNNKQQLRRIRVRLSFYDFVILGGKVLLGIAGIFLLALLVLIAPTGPSELEDRET